MRIVSYRVFFSVISLECRIASFRCLFDHVNISLSIPQDTDEPLDAKTVVTIDIVILAVSVSVGVDKKAV